LSEEIKNTNDPERAANNNEPEIVLNNNDNTVVVEEKDRTVVLTDDETIVIDKAPEISVVPANRPRKVYGGMWGPVQIAIVGAGLFTLLCSILFYVLFVVPSNREIETNRLESQRLEAELISSREKYGDITNTQEHVEKLITSINDFETRFLPRPDLGKTALYQRLNGLIHAYGLVNTTGPAYVPLELAEQGKTSGDETGRAKYRSIYPGTYVTVTLEGSYQNLRRFIREIETSSEFVVISSIELEPSNNSDKNADQAGQAEISTVSQDFPGVNDPRAPSGSSRRTDRGVNRGQIVTLRLEMAAYFKRPNFSAEPPPVPADTQ
jgi:hypothetical protein